MDEGVLSKRISEWVAGARERIVGLTSDLIRYNTVNRITDGTELPAQLALYDYWKEMKLDTQLYSPESAPGFREHPAYYPGKDYTNRPNVAGVWKGSGGGRSLLFSSHIDTAVEASGWTSSPWEPRLERDRLYGLGAYDMKGGLAASTMAVRCLMELGVRPSGDVILESVVDEEFGGANGTLAARLMGYRADAAILPEPTNLAVCPATRGGALWRLTFRGQTGMSFNGETFRNPVYDAARFLVYLEQFERERNLRGGLAPWYDSEGDLPVIPTRAKAGNLGAALCDVGPDVCEIDVWVECHPGETEQSLRESILEGYRRSGLAEERIPDFRSLIRFLPGSQVPPDFPLLGVLREQVAGVTGRPAALKGAPFACDAFMFNLYSPTPAVVLGPCGANAHAADEYVDVGSLLALTEIYARTIVAWCGIQPNEEAVSCAKR